jgi:hypothetical protein
MLVMNVTGAWASPLLAAAVQGDAAAIELLRRLLPQNLPPAERRVLRNSRIRLLAAYVSTAFPGHSNHAVANFLASAGQRIESGRSLAGPPFTALDENLPPFVVVAKNLLEWLPVNRRTGCRWPVLETIVAVIST